MTGAVDTSGEHTLALRKKIADLEATLGAIRDGGVDAVILGQAPQERLYTLASADRPYRLIIESMGEGALTISERGVVLFANAVMARFMGCDRSALVGRDVGSLFAGRSKRRLTTLLKTGEGDTARAQLTLSSIAGRRGQVLVSVTGLDMEGALLRCLVVTDLTAQKAAEAQLAARAAMEREMASRRQTARDVNDTIVQGLVAAEMALDLSQLKLAREIVATTSHQARDWIGELLAGDALKPGGSVRRDIPDQGVDQRP